MTPLLTSQKSSKAGGQVSGDAANVPESRFQQQQGASTSGAHSNTWKEIDRFRCTWRRPPSKCYKLNCDASWCEAKNRGSVASVLRDETGRFIYAGCRSSKERWPISVLEAQAICEGMEAIPIPCDKDILVESDCLQVIKLIRMEDSDLMEVSLFIEVIHRLATKAKFVSFSHVPRECNGDANVLARRASLWGLSEEWGGSPPEWLSEVLQADSLGS